MAPSRRDWLAGMSIKGSSRPDVRRPPAIIPGGGRSPFCKGTRWRSIYTIHLINIFVSCCLSFYFYAQEFW
ncbi:hypothetical protein AB205_0073700 [Aquarana catesbeiana]|uniref:Uncharacterized protein n=1 Tax=Aquarana catesbeiana TaxID=8400 RepID=A0A2G9R6E2_AQUCT|nr:hypothetical protein AB205_0073700 [Aquarana catesbeiana]